MRTGMVCVAAALLLGMTATAWADSPTLTLTADESCYTTNGGTVTVDIVFTQSATADEILGGQFFIDYDNTKLTFVSVTTGDSPFTRQVYVDTTTAGQIDYAVGIPDGPPDGYSGLGPITMAAITFTTADQACSVADLVSFRDTSGVPYDTRLTMEDGNGNGVPLEVSALNNLSAITLDWTDPVATAPTNVTVECIADVPTAAATYAEFTAQGGTASDNCSAGADLTITHVDGPLTGGECGGTITRTYTVADECGNDVDVIQTITVDDTIAPTFDLPADITQNADAGGCTLTLTLAEIGWPSNLDDNCSLVGDIVVTWTRSDAAPNLDDPFPTGATTITWKVEDECGNFETAAGLTEQTITVEAYNTFVVDVQIEGALYDPNPGVAGDTITRCILFEFDCNAPDPAWYAEELVTFSVDDDGTNGYSITPPDQLITDLPCGSYTCVTAEDELHSLRVTLSPTISGDNWSASFTGVDKLTQGDLYNDELIDIGDFGTFIAEWGETYGGNRSTDCATAWPHADLSADAAIGTADFSFLQTHFLEVGDLDCCGIRGGVPCTSLTIDELTAMGLPYWVDLTGDGVLDIEDIEAFLNGAEPDPGIEPMEDELSQQDDPVDEGDTLSPTRQQRR